MGLFTWDYLKYYYNEMKNIFTNSNSKTRNKAILLPKVDKRVSEKNNHIPAIKTFNQLPNDIKTLEIDIRSTMFKLQKWVANNIVMCSSTIIEHKNESVAKQLCMLFPIRVLSVD